MSSVPDHAHALHFFSIFVIGIIIRKLHHLPWPPFVLTEVLTWLQAHFKNVCNYMQRSKSRSAKDDSTHSTIPERTSQFNHQFNISPLPSSTMAVRTSSSRLNSNRISLMYFADFAISLLLLMFQIFNYTFFPGALKCMRGSSNFLPFYKPPNLEYPWTSWRSSFHRFLFPYEKPSSWLSWSIFWLILQKLRRQSPGRNVYLRRSWIQSNFTNASIINSRQKFIHK